MDKKKIVRAYIAFKDILREKIFPKSLRGTIAAMVPNIVKAINNAARVPAWEQAEMGWGEEYPELWDEKYIIPTLLSGVMIQLNSDPKGVLGSLLSYKKGATGDDAILAGVCINTVIPFVNSNRYLDNRAHRLFALKDSTWTKREKLGEVLSFRVIDIVDKILEPYVFVREESIVVITPSITWSKDEGVGRTVRIEEFFIETIGSANTGMTYLDVYHPEGAVVETLQDLIDFYVENNRLRGFNTGDPSKHLAEYLKFVWLIESSNIETPDPVEFNETRAQLEANGKRTQALKHPSYRFIDMDDVRFHISNSAKKEGGEPTGRTVTPHARRGHFRGVWCGSMEKGNRHLEIRWIAPTLVGGGNNSENRVFYVI